MICMCFVDLKASYFQNVLLRYLMLNLIAYNLNKYSLRDMNTSYCDFKINAQHCTILCKENSGFWYQKVLHLLI